MINQLYLNNLDPFPLIHNPLISIKVIYIRKTTIESLNHRFGHTVMLYLINCTLSGINGDYIMQKYPNLNTLYLNGVQNVDPKMSLFQKPIKHQLFTFALINIGLRTLKGVDLLANISSLRAVSLAHNKITKIDNEQFFPVDAKHFWFLDLSYNYLRTFEWKMPLSIKHLKLDHNYLKQLFPLIYNSFREISLVGKQFCFFIFKTIFLTGVAQKQDLFKLMNLHFRKNRRRLICSVQKLNV